MYRDSFPRCEIKGDLKPVEYGHMVSQGAIPKKCSTCSNLFEGECMRALDDIDNLLRLDYNSCEKLGSTKPTEIEKVNGNSIFIPNKCLNCEHLTKSQIHGYFCNYENEKWKDFPRDLDWGDWKPDYPLIGHRRYRKEKYSTEDLGLAIINKELVLLLMKKETVKAIKLYKSLNKIETIKEANEDIKILMTKLNKM